MFGPILGPIIWYLYLTCVGILFLFFVAGVLLLPYVVWHDWRLGRRRGGQGC